MPDATSPKLPDALAHLTLGYWLAISTNVCNIVWGLYLVFWAQRIEGGFLSVVASFIVVMVIVISVAARKRVELLDLKIEKNRTDADMKAYMFEEMKKHGIQFQGGYMEEDGRRPS